MTVLLRRKLSSFSLAFRMLAFLKEVRLRFAVSCLLMVAGIGIGVLSVYFLSPAITTVGEFLGTEKSSSFLAWLTGESSSAAQLRWIVLLLVLTHAGSGLLGYIRTVWDTKLSMVLVSKIRSRVFNHLQNLPACSFNRYTTGQLINRALNDVGAVHSFSKNVLLDILDMVVSLSAYLLLLSVRSPWLLLAAFVPLPFWLWAISRYNKRAKPCYQRQQLASDSLMQRLSENLAGQAVIQTLGTKGWESKRYQEANTNYLSELLGLVRLQSILGPGLQCIAAAAHIGAFILCAWLIQRGQIPLGDVMILGAAMGTVLSKLQKVSQIADSYQRAMVSGQRLFELLDHPVEAPSQGRPLLVHRGQLQLVDLSYSYSVSQGVLNQLNCSFPAGQVSVITGPSGSGKSTLAALMGRIYEPTQGRILIDGQDISKHSLKDLRYHVGFAFQESYLFSDTVFGNIAFGKPGASEEEIVHAARLAHAHEFILNLPGGYQTRLGEDGVELSGGQRQRIALARALVYNPRILILDDVTSALDTSTEEAILKNLPEAFAGRTVVFISHRPKVLSLADYHVELRNGTLVEQKLTTQPSSLTTAGLLTQLAPSSSTLLKEYN